MPVRQEIHSREGPSSENTHTKQCDAVDDVVANEFHELEVEVSKDDQEEYPDGGFKAYLVLTGSFLGLTANFGTLNSVGAIQTYLATHQLADIPASTIAWIFSLFLSIAFALTIFVGPYFDSKGATRPLVLGNILVFGGLMVTAECQKVWQFILGFSICCGVGCALCISPLVGVVSHWFLSNIGFAIGLSSIGGSVGGVCIPLMLRSLYPKVGYAWAIRVLAFFCLACNTVACVLIRERFKTKLELKGENKTKRLLEASRHFFNYSAMKDSRFLFLVLGVTCGELALLSIATYYGTYAVAQGMSESSSYILLTIFNGTGVLGRLLPGYLSDIIGHFNMMILMLIGSTLSTLVIWLPFGHNHVVLYLFISVFGFTSSSILSLTPACLRQITPVKEFGARYGLMYFFVSLGNLVGIPIAAAIIGDSSKRNYDMFALFCGLMTLLATVLWVIGRYRLVKFKLNVKV